MPHRWNRAYINGPAVIQFEVRQDPTTSPGDSSTSALLPAAATD